jgi:hypothetical protein
LYLRFWSSERVSIKREEIAHLSIENVIYIIPIRKTAEIPQDNVQTILYFIFKIISFILILNIKYEASCYLSYIYFYIDTTKFDM